MPFGKRLPILLLLGSAVVYVGSNYRIDGLNQLRLARRPSAPDGFQGESHPNGFGSASLPSPYGAMHPDSTTTHGLSSSPSPSVFDALPPWEPKLSVGEKLAVMQEQLSQKMGELSRTPSSDATALPLAPPLSLPAELQRNRPFSSLPSSNGHHSAHTESLHSGANGRNKPSSGVMAGTGIFEGQPSTIRIASFCLDGLDAPHFSRPYVSEITVSIIRMFDIVAIQAVEFERDDILPMLVERLNSSGRRYDYLIGPRVGRGASQQQFAFVFDTARVETDRYQLYTVEDPEDLICYEPLVAWFRCKQVPADQSFTFSIANLRISHEHAVAEQAFLPNLIHAIVNDGRQEDDVMIVGDFAGNTAGIANLSIESIRHAIGDLPTEVTGQKTLSGIILPAQATCEYTGRSGVYDFLRKHNLSLERALEVSSHLPVWAEFYVIEGAQPGRVAPPRETVL